MEVSRHTLKIRIPEYTEEEEVGSIQRVKKKNICSKLSTLLNKMIFSFILYIKFN